MIKPESLSLHLLSFFSVLAVSMTPSSTKADSIAVAPVFNPFFIVKFNDSVETARRPSTPGNITGLAYSRTALEIFWERSTGLLPLHYNVYRDNNLIGSTEGTSWFEEGLDADTRYEYRIDAVDVEGSISVAGTAFAIRTRGGPNSSTIVPAVTGLHADVYSRTFAEIFWDRPSGKAYRYLIFVNNVQVEETDGISWWSRDFLPDRRTEVSVVAVDDSGAQSAPVTITVDTSDGSAGTISPVSGLRVDVYSRTAAEVFWDRKTGMGIRYRVLADGVEVTDTDGTSWYSNDFVPGSTTSISVVAIDSDGNQSEAKSVTVTTPGNEQPPDPMSGLLFSERPLETIAPHLFTSLIAQDLDDVVVPGILVLHDAVAATALSSEVLEFDPPESNPPFGTSGSDIVYQCDGGGSLQADLNRKLANTGVGTRFDINDTYKFTSCQVAVSTGSLPAGIYAVDGTFAVKSSHFSGRGVNRNFEHQWSAFVMTDPDGMRSEIDGQTAGGFIDSLGSAFIRSRSVLLSEYRQVKNEKITKSIGNVRVELSDNSGAGTFTSFKSDINGVVLSADTADLSVTVGTNLAFSQLSAFNGDFQPFAGQLQAMSDNGNTLVFTASTQADASEERLVIYQLNVGSASSTGILPYSALKIPEFLGDLDNIDDGFPD